MENVLRCIGMQPISATDLIENLQMTDARFRHQAEDLGLSRIYRGYGSMTDEEWVRKVFDLGNKLDSYEGVYVGLASFAPRVSCLSVIRASMYLTSAWCTT